MLADPPPLQEEPGERLEAELCAQLGGLPRDPFGHIWVRRSRVVALVPWRNPPELGAPAFLFLDESREDTSATFLYGALAVPAIWALVVAARHLEALTEVRRAYPPVWPDAQPPPRLHLRELYPEVARRKTPWMHVPEADLRELVRAILPAITDQRVARYIVRTHEPSMERAIGRAFPKRNVEISDLRLQAAACLLRIALARTVSPGLPLEVVVDHDKTPIRVGQHRRQATLRFLERLATIADQSMPAHSLRWPDGVRHSSAFPAELTWKRLATAGMAMRAVLACIWLQLVDLYLGLWRQVALQEGSPLGISAAELGEPHVEEIEWLQE